ncbi:MAG: hypothetical protein PHX80_04775 [Candidatus Nanoarchaeia archaeon]|nr:hypothetical protein [Candidatus Nanoarchaeia archaeon]
MINGIIIKQFNAVVRKTIDKYSEKYKSAVSLMISPKINSPELRIQILSNYRPVEEIGIKDLDIPFISPKIVENKILTGIQKIADENALKKPAVLLINEGDIKPYLYDSGKTVSKLNLEKLL